MRLRFALSLALASSSVAFGCSSSDPLSAIGANANTGNVSGVVAAARVTTRSAVARTGDLFSSDGGTKRGLRLLVSDKANTCGGFHFASSTSVEVRLRTDSVAPGSYPIVDATVKAAATEQAEAVIEAIGATCQDVVAQTATTGTLTIRNVEYAVVGPGTSHVSGFIDATFPGGHVAGDFDAVYCDEAGNTESTADGGAPVTCN